MKVHPVGAELFDEDGQTEGRTDMKELTVAFPILRERLERTFLLAWNSWTISVRCNKIRVESVPFYGDSFI
jgi:hypothetical protein